MSKGASTALTMALEIIVQEGVLGKLVFCQARHKPIDKSVLIIRSVSYLPMCA